LIVYLPIAALMVNDAGKSLGFPALLIAYAELLVVVPATVMTSLIWILVFWNIGDL